MSSNIFSTIKSTFSTIRPGKTLYYPGCMTSYYLTPVLNNYKALLSDFGIGFIMIDELVCCGAPLLNGGYQQDFEKIKNKNLEILRKYGISKVITNCPHCYGIFKEKYGVETEHIAQTLAKNKHKISYYNKEEVVYHDSCILARQNNIINEPRTLIKQTGLKIVEPSRTKNKTFCCGAGGGMKQNYPEIANKIARERLKQLGSNKIIVACPYCYAHLSENADNKKNIIELSEALLHH